ncbi:DUF4240 domain-containing protein [Bacillus cereus group sp. TH152-1LC]|uniref:DUF4240 domain-containing protein n=1 Tax=Bacillus cereus group sp. TH152-1LC TaxID=3018060 RepID=UPI0022E44116|nr:DUF4240 domain-containing protein [Bacillus cereus group sp. TH152-1LC]MDA1675287.1 DUF4240 domain-containing protein [Bacillus cereus group sp. TH152-1LC]
MDEREFWDLLNQSVTMEENQYNWLVNQLAEKKVIEIVEFKEFCSEIYINLVRNMELGSVLQARVSFVSDDGYSFFCEWLISKGEEVIKSVLEDPNNLIQILPEKTEFPPSNEGFTYVPAEAYAKKRRNVLDDVDTSEDENKFVLLITDDFYEAIQKVNRD